MRSVSKQGHLQLRCHSKATCRSLNRQLQNGLFSPNDFTCKIFSLNSAKEITIFAPHFHEVTSLIRTLASLYNTLYYMAISASGQDDPNHAMWLATQAGNMEPSCPLRTTHCIPQEKFPQKPYNKSFIDLLSLFGQDGQIVAKFLFCKFMDLTSSQSINMQKTNLVDTQPSWPHTWSISFDTDCITSPHRNLELIPGELI